MTNSLLSKLDEPRAEAWMPVEEGDTIAGTVVGMSSRDAGYGEYPILTIECTDIVGGKLKDGTAAPKPPTTLALHCLGVVLTNEVGDAGVDVGHEVAARYNGKKEGRNGNTYDSWSFASEKPSALSKLDKADADHAGLFKS